MNCKVNIQRAEQGYQYEGLEALGLTPRESQILLLRAAGLTYKACAEIMNCSINNVKARMLNIFYKLNVENTQGAIATAFKTGHLRVIAAATVWCLLVTLAAEPIPKSTLARVQNARTRIELAV